MKHVSSSLVSAKPLHVQIPSSKSRSSSLTLTTRAEKLRFVNVQDMVDATEKIKASAEMNAVRLYKRKCVCAFGWMMLGLEFWPTSSLIFCLLSFLFP